MSESDIPSDEKMSIKRRGILSATINVMPFDTNSAMPTKMVAWNKFASYLMGLGPNVSQECQILEDSNFWNKITICMTIIIWVLP